MVHASIAIGRATVRCRRPQSKICCLSLLPGGNTQTDAADFQASDEEKRGHCGMGVVGAHVWGRRTTSPMASPKNRPAVCPVCFWKALNL